MTFNIITLFPEMFSPLEVSILRRARDKGIIDINLINLRDFAKDKHKTVDDTPYGGGKGMVLKVDVVDRAISNIKNKILIKGSPSKVGSPSEASGRLHSQSLGRDDNNCAVIPAKAGIQDYDLNNCIDSHRSLPPRVIRDGNDEYLRTILLTPKGQSFNQDKAKELAKYDNIILICGHYEGFDERIRQLADEEISIGDFVLTGGEIPAMAVVDAVARLVPGVLSENSADTESFMEKDELGNYLLEAPQYTRPESYNGSKVPEVLLSGNHAEIAKWREAHTETKP